jgi:hypothetical protein
VIYERENSQVLDQDFKDDFYSRDITLERAVYTVLPLIANHIIKKHRALVFAVVAADIALEVSKHRKSKKRFGDLILLKDFQ